jgi:hypothetical protein
MSVHTDIGASPIPIVAWQAVTAHESMSGVIGTDWIDHVAPKSVLDNRAPPYCVSPIAAQNVADPHETSDRSRISAGGEMFRQLAPKFEVTIVAPPWSAPRRTIAPVATQ